MTERDALAPDVRTSTPAQLRAAREAIKVARDRAHNEGDFEASAYFGRRADACSRQLSRLGEPQHAPDVEPDAAACRLLHCDAPATHAVTLDALPVRCAACQHDEGEHINGRAECCVCDCDTFTRADADDALPVPVCPAWCTSTDHDAEARNQHEGAFWHVHTMEDDGWKVDLAQWQPFTPDAAAAMARGAVDGPDETKPRILPYGPELTPRRGARVR